MPTDAGIVNLYDSQTKSFRQTGIDGTASMYVCGITPYDATHLGHAATYLAFDLLNRVWRDAEVEVSYVQNVTDIDDPLLERASQTGRDWRDIAQRETELFFSDMTALRVLPPNAYESAVESIPDVIDLVQQISASAAYLVDDDWYFHSEAVGQVCGWDRPKMEAIFAERGGDPQRAGKRDPLDSLLWRAERAGEPMWQGSLGAGRPGWHIECVAIALRHLHAPLTVQGGGRDLLFPHHDICNAQVLEITGKPLAQVYVHAGLIGYQGEKMSKSLGNLVLVSQLRANGVSMSALRLALAAGHYREDREWDESVLARGEQRLALWSTYAASDASDIVADVRAALRNDLDTISAMTVIDQWCVAKRTLRASSSPLPLRDLVDGLFGVEI